MTVALLLLGLLVGAGLLLWLHDRFTGKVESSSQATDEPEPGTDNECCGMHITCERDSLLASVSADIEYYDDEELDAYRDRDPETYGEAEIEQFRDVLLTLLPDDIAPWARSLQLRGIELPADVRDELLLIVSEERARRTATSASANATTV